MLSSLFKTSIYQHTIKKAVTYSASRYFATAKESENTNKVSKKETLEQAAEKQSSKKDVELPDFPEFPHIRSDFEAGIRSREYLKNLPSEKRINILKQKPGSILYFDDEEFKHYFPHE